MRMTVRNVRSHTHTASLTRMALGNASMRACKYYNDCARRANEQIVRFRQHHRAHPLAPSRTRPAPGLRTRRNGRRVCPCTKVSEEQLYLFPPLSFIGASGGYVGGVV